MSDRIVDFEPYGRHIQLKCKVHTNKRWSTKNIQYIGARTIYYNLQGIEGMGPECSCSINELVPLTEDEVLQEMIDEEEGKKSTYEI